MDAFLRFFRALHGPIYTPFSRVKVKKVFLFEDTCPIESFSLPLTNAKKRAIGRFLEALLRLWPSIITDPITNFVPPVFKLKNTPRWVDAVFFQRVPFKCEFRSISVVLVDHPPIESDKLTGG